MNVSEFLHMGGYAMFVWPSYGLTLIVLLMNWWLPYQQHKQNLRKLKRQYRQDKKSNDSSS